VVEKKVTVETNDRKKHYFKVNESNGKFFVYRDAKKLGEAKSFDLALSIIRTHVNGVIHIN